MKTDCIPQVFPEDAGPIGVYVHIPFCLSRCDYCGFVSYPFDPVLEGPYIEAVIREILTSGTFVMLGNYTSPKYLDTIYLGGGTPSVFSPGSIERLICSIKKKFNLVDPVEITLEVNPGTYHKNEFLELLEIGINRISIGAQSLHDRELRTMNRLHSTDEFLEVFSEVRAAGLKNVSVDLLAGYPGQTIKSVIESLKRIMELGPEHVSVYLLEIKPNSRIDDRMKLGRDKLLDDDLVADMYQVICKELGSSGFNQYEISNFSKPGMESRHNLKYWTDKVYLGFGLAAHGMTGRTRYSNMVDLERYFVATSSKAPAIESLIKMNPLTRFKDALIMGLRLTNGVDLTLMSSRYEFDSHRFVKKALRGLDRARLFTMEKNTIKLTPRGRLLSNIIFSRFV